MSAFSPTADLVVQACQSFGSRVPLWTQGAGGNLSCKDGEALWIKASGSRLDTVTREKGLAKVSWKAVEAGLQRPFSDENAGEIFYAELLGQHAEKANGLGRPSMETGFHAQLGRDWVAHFHSAPAVLMAHEYQKQPKRVQHWLAEHCDFLIDFLPGVRPGWLLSQRLAKHRTSDLIILANHGLIVQSGEPLQVGVGPLAEWEVVEKQFCRQFGYSELYSLPEKSLPPGPLKFYFPDVAVFLTRLKSLLIPTADETFQLNEKAWTDDRDMAEIWTVVQWLYRVCPSLEELPQGITSKVASLPTELFRRETSL